MITSRPGQADASIGTLIARARTSQNGARTAGREGPIRVVFADDSYLIREALHEVLASLEGIDLLASYADGESLLTAVDADPPDVVIVDIRMPPSGDDEGIRIARQLRESHPDIGVVVLSQYAGAAYALALLEGGAEGRGYLLKERVHDRAELLAAIEVVAQGGTTIDPSLVQELLAADRQRHASPLDELTPREREVLAEMAEGRSNASIAESLVLTKRAVEKHVGAIFQKLCLEDDGVVSRRVTAVLLYLAEAEARI
ncbi:MAG TPA: response regulator transcription factor [Candidatus Limnocylindrales bacterium]|nr:response regulator transcription factor [Candidatus Limnocylindrales bacterium]